MNVQLCKTMHFQILLATDSGFSILVLQVLDSSHVHTCYTLLEFLFAPIIHMNKASETSELNVKCKKYSFISCGVLKLQVW